MSDSAQSDRRLVLFNNSTEPCQLALPDFGHVQVVDVRWKEEGGNAGVKDSFDLIFVVGHFPLVHIVKIRQQFPDRA